MARNGWVNPGPRIPAQASGAGRPLASGGIPIPLIGAFTVGTDPRTSRARPATRRPRLHPSPSGPPGVPQAGRSTGTRPRWSCSSRRFTPRPGGCVLSAQALEPAPRPRSAFCARASRSHGESGWGCLLPVLVSNRSTHVSWSRPWVIVVGPTGRPRSGCRPEAVPGPACPWACGSRSAWWCVVGSRRALDGAACESSGALKVAGFCGPARSRGEKRRGSIPLVADPRRKRPARGAAPLRLGWVAPNRTVHRDATAVVVFVERFCPRPGGCVLSRPCARTRSATAERVLRARSRPHSISARRPRISPTRRSISASRPPSPER